MLILAGTYAKLASAEELLNHIEEGLRRKIGASWNPTNKTLNIERMDTAIECSRQVAPDL
jgi:hypothetical protein